MAIVWKLNWGITSGVPLSGDYNGDGKTDLAMYQQTSGKWYVRTLAGAYLIYGQQWGGSSYVPVKP